MLQIVHWISILCFGIVDLQVEHLTISFYDHLVCNSCIAIHRPFPEYYVILLSLYYSLHDNIKNILNNLFSLGAYGGLCRRIRSWNSYNTNTIIEFNEGRGSANITNIYKSTIRMVALPQEEDTIKPLHYGP